MGSGPQGHGKEQHPAHSPGAAVWGRGGGLAGAVHPPGEGCYRIYILKNNVKIKALNIYIYIINTKLT